MREEDPAIFPEEVVIVTGAGRGIGRSVSVALARAGATARWSGGGEPGIRRKVVLAARSRDQLEAVAREIREHGGEAVPIVTDVSREEDVLSLFGAVKERFGRLDVLVNNAGAGAFGPIEEFSAADFDRVLSTNLRGTFLCSREALKMMKPRGRGTIINISSVVGFKGYPRQAAYTASKHGVMGLTKSLAAEAQEAGIRVSAVLPGGVDTDLVAQARPDLDRSKLLQPEDIAETVMFLLSLPERAAIDEIYIRRRSSQPF